MQNLHIAVNRLWLPGNQIERLDIISDSCIIEGQISMKNTAHNLSQNMAFVGASSPRETVTTQRKGVMNT